MQSLLFHNVNLTFQKLLEILPESYQVEEAASFLQVDQKIDIA